MTPRISVIIPTQRRPAPLMLAARSVIAQAGVDLGGIELIIADNDQTPSAMPQVEELRRAAPFALIYVHEPRPGVANVRNAAMAVARGELIAFLDDDEEAPPGWLAELLAVLSRFEADAVFGPVRGRASPAVTRHRAYLERFFSREGPAATQAIEGHYGCGNSLVRRAAMPDPRRPFCDIRNHIGGEDDLLFQTMAAGGARFAWAAEAWVWEDPAPERLNLRYAIARAFAYGQGPTSASAAARQWGGVVRWMAVGAVQAAIYGAVAAAKWVSGAGDRAEALDRAARGLGKLCWFGPFKIRFYGRSAGAAG
jgi:glycosyltransferase involved in cell wall biosynthesis